MSALDDFINEIRCYDENWFDELQGRSAKQELSALRSRIAELEALTTWQPISSAPKDGLRIRLCENPQGVTGRWRTINGRSGWFSEGYFIKPTHWMPLLEPPKEQE